MGSRKGSRRKVHWEETQVLGQVVRLARFGKLVARRSRSRECSGYGFRVLSGTPERSSTTSRRFQIRSTAHQATKTRKEEDQRHRYGVRSLTSPHRSLKLA